MAIHLCPKTKLMFSSLYIIEKRRVAVDNAGRRLILGPKESLPKHHFESEIDISSMLQEIFE